MKDESASTENIQAIYGTTKETKKTDSSCMKFSKQDIVPRTMTI